VQFVTANGATIAALGYGTYGMPLSDMLRMIPAALNAGSRNSAQRPFRQRTSPIVLLWPEGAFEVPCKFR
jgi:hypothetical protein